ncbi:DUF2330 domain-containing protein [Flexivirga alba]|uniref:DUF2330 domain-containing protein n=1 Tax=Flexivirga alba TaxID=702742 RepID=A0ABW2AHU8_9MICO
MVTAWWLRRSAQLLTAVVMATIGLVVVTPPAMACACGGMVQPPGNSTTVTGETALVTQGAGRETIVMSLSAKSDAARAGLLVPTPAPATPALADRDIFTDLADQTAPRSKERHHFFGPPLFFGDHGSSGSDNEARSSPAGVQVLGEVDLGPLKAVSIKANNAADLHSWLDSRGFVMSPQFEALVTPYLDKGWAFTAMTLTAEGKSLTGTLPPVSLEFASDTLVYPMRMSSGAKETQHVRTYVLADHRVERTDPTATQGQLHTAYADRVRTSLVTSPDLKRLSAGKAWLTEFTQTFDHPGEQVRSDFTFARAPHDTPVVHYAYRDEYFIPVDVAVLLVVSAAAIAGAIVLIRRRQRRS